MFMVSKKGNKEEKEYEIILYEKDETSWNMREKNTEDTFHRFQYDSLVLKESGGKCV